MRNKILPHLFASLLLTSGTALAQTPAPALVESSPASAKVSAERLARLDAFIQGYVDKGELNGATAIVIRDGRIIYHKAFGYSDMGKGTRMRTDNIFRIASMTKPIVSVAAMMLFEEGRFLLDDPVSRYIPAFRNPRVLDAYHAEDTGYTTVPAKSEITIRQLLNHTSGIGYAQIGGPEARAIYSKNGVNGGIGTPYGTLKESVGRLATLPLFHHPGEKYLYGLNTDVLGHLIEVVSGMPLDRFLRERIFLPLGMTDTYFFLPEEKGHRLVRLYRQDPEGRLSEQPPVIPLNGDFHRDFPLKRDGSYFSGGAGLSSTARDYAVFCQMLLNGGAYGGKRILSPHTLRIMTRNQIGDLLMNANPEAPNRFGLGFGVYTERSEAVYPLQAGSFDWGGMFASHFWIDPKTRLACVIMRNIWPTRNRDLGDRSKIVIYQALED